MVKQAFKLLGTAHLEHPSPFYEPKAVFGFLKKLANEVNAHIFKPPHLLPGDNFVLFFSGHLCICFCAPEAQETVLENLPGARGFAVLQYGPVASHADLIHPRNYELSMFLTCQTC